MEHFVNFSAETTLNGAINSSIASLAIVPVSGSPTLPQFRIWINDELILVTGVAGPVYQVERGIEGTLAASHAHGSAVHYVLTAGALGGQSDAAAGVPSLRSLGTSSTQAAAGDDVRLSDSRPPEAHTHVESEVIGLSSDLLTLIEDLGTEATARASADMTETGDRIAADAAHVSAADPHPGYQKESEKNQASGYAGLDGAGKLSGTQQTYGIIAGTAAEGNDARLSDARAALPHAATHNAGGSDALAIDAAAGVGSLRTLGSGALQAVAGNDARFTGIVYTGDARLSDARVPLAHAASHRSGGSDVLRLDELGLPTDVATLNASTLAHGLLPKLSGGTTAFLRGDGAWAVPSYPDTSGFVLSSDYRLSDARTPTAHAVTHKSGGTDALKLDELAAPTDIATLNASVLAHGLLSKLGGGTANFLRADGAWSPLVNSITGTANQVVASSAQGNVTLSLPQNIHAGATPTFAGLALTGVNARLDFDTVGNDGERGIYWSAGSAYGIYRSAGPFSAPDYAQLVLAWPTGIVLNPGSAFGKSYVAINGGLRVGASSYVLMSHDGSGHLQTNIGSLLLGAGGSDLFVINAATGHFYPISDNGQDFGAPANRVRAGYIEALHAASVVLGGDVLLVRDSSLACLALRNGANPQSLLLYRTYTDASNWERLQIDSDSANGCRIFTNYLGTGGTNDLSFGVNTGVQWSIGGSTGTFFPINTTTYDFGDATHRIRIGYFGGLNATLPTSASGLPAGSIWNNAGVLNIV